MRHARRGTTTLEVTVTLAIIAVFSSMAVLNMDGVRRKSRERDALREISVQALQARANARTSQYPVRLFVRLNPNGPGSQMRWEQLDCNPNLGRWGSSFYCPAQACQSNECGKGGCKCVATGEYISIPYTLEVKSLNGLCWMGQGAQPRQVSTGGKSCVRDEVPPQAPYRITQKASGKLDHLLEVNGLTGRARMVDCTEKNPEAICN